MRWDDPPNGRWSRGWLSEVLDQDLAVALALEGHLAGKHLVDQNAESVDVGSVINLAPPFALFRRHVSGRSHDNAGSRPTRPRLITGEFGNPEVEHFYEVGLVPLRLHDDVVRLEIAVDDVCAMRSSEGVSRLDRDPESALRCERCLLTDELRQALASEKLHDEIHHRISIGPTDRSVVDDVDDVRMLNVVDRFCFIEKARDNILVRGEFGVEDFECDLLTDQRVLGHVDRTHPTLAELMSYFVVAYLGADQWIAACGLLHNASVGRTHLTTQRVVNTKVLVV